MIQALMSGDRESIVITVFVYLMIIFLITPIHEFAHAWAAYKMGDDTAKLRGRLTLNPLASIDPLGTLTMVLFGFGWGKPVPVNPLRFKKYRKGIGLVSLAGPLSNFIAAFVGIIIMKFLYVAGQVNGSDTTMLVGDAMYLFTTVNIGLGVFNLIPIPPLDGSGVISWLAPDKTARKYDDFVNRYRNFLPLALFAFLYSPVPSMIKGVVYIGLDKLTFFAYPIAQAILS